MSGSESSLTGAAERSPVLGNIAVTDAMNTASAAYTTSIALHPIPLLHRRHLKCQRRGVWGRCVIGLDPPTGLLLGGKRWQHWDHFALVVPTAHCLSPARKPQRPHLGAERTFTPCTGVF